MLRISGDQVDVFRSATLAKFEEQMMERCAELGPLRCAALGVAGLRAAVRATIRRAADHGFTFRGPVRLFVELSLLLGAGFDRDEMVPFAAQILAEDGSQTDRADELYAHAVAFIKEVSGPGGRHEHDAWVRLRGLLAAEPAWGDGRDVAASLLTTMAAVYPEKAARVGEPALRGLIGAAEREAAAHDMHAAEDVALVASLMFAVGAGCFTDPFHAWIAASVDRGRIADRTLVGKLLRREAMGRF